MIVNVIHRPGQGKQYEMFRLQQRIAHELNLKVTLLIPYDFMFDAEVDADLMRYHEAYGDELGIWMGELTGGRMQQTVPSKEPFLWLHTKENKVKILKEVLRKFRTVFGMEPHCFGGYHMDAYSLSVLHELCPAVEISIAGCFEEGVKVFHGCNNSWYLFNEGMPWGPWYPAKENSLRPASGAEDWCGIVGVPHLSRDMALSYEGRNDFFASHPANVQRAMANDGAVAPYTLNLLDVYRYQERFNDGFSYTNVFVGPNWLSGSANVQDSDEITQGLYREYLEYYSTLQEEGSLQSMYLSEFAAWFRNNVPIGKAQVFDAKEILYGSMKNYFWYCDCDMRVMFDLFQGCSIGDLRPYVARQPRCTGADMPQKMIGSNPYLIQSQYRTGNAHHFADGARSTLILSCGGEHIDLAGIPMTLQSVRHAEDMLILNLKPQILCFKNGTNVEFTTEIVLRKGGIIEFRRRLLSVSGDENQIFATEYVKGCWGTTEYPEEMHGLELKMIDTEQVRSIVYNYEGRILTGSGKSTIEVTVPQLETTIALSPLEGDFVQAELEEGFLFNPYYTMKQTARITQEKGMRTQLCMRKG